MKYESTFSAIDKILWNEAGCSNELDYIEQTSWLLFLKYLDDLETDMEFKAELENKTYKRIITGFNRWSSWAAPKKAPGEADTINAMTGDDLVKFVNEKLFPALAKFKETARETNTLEYKIGEIFSELRNKIQSGYNLREVINKIDTLHFQSAEDKHEMSVLYEDKIKRMGNAGRNGGEYYTPRPLIRSIIKVVDPKIGETVYDPACGTGGMLIEAIRYMNDDRATYGRIYGQEKNLATSAIARMNLFLHGAQDFKVTQGDTLRYPNYLYRGELQTFDCVIANPPFSLKNWGADAFASDVYGRNMWGAPSDSNADFAWLQHMVKSMDPKTGRCTVI